MLIGTSRSRRVTKPQGKIGGLITSIYLNREEAFSMAKDNGTSVLTGFGGSQFISYPQAAKVRSMPCSNFLTF